MREWEWFFIYLRYWEREETPDGIQGTMRQSPPVLLPPACADGVPRAPHEQIKRGRDRRTKPHLIP